MLAVLSFLPVNHRYEAARLVERLMCVAETREPAVKDDSEFSELRRSNGMLILLEAGWRERWGVWGERFSVVAISNVRGDGFRGESPRVLPTIRKHVGFSDR